ncbi:MAG TPA: response regulator [Gemmatimonadales bacterium]|nr:response regulator [Gemmatimonadales bacterium]
MIPPPTRHRLTRAERAAEHVRGGWAATQRQLARCLAEVPVLMREAARWRERVWVESPWRDAVRVRLRVTPKEADSEPRPWFPPVAPSGRRRLNILLVEPDARTRRALTRLLQRARMAVLPVGDGRMALDALKIAASRGGSFDLVIAAARLPDLTTPELVRRLRVARPALPVLRVCPARDGLPPGGRPIPTAPLLPLVEPLRWPQLAAGIEHAVLASTSTSSGASYL